MNIIHYDDCAGQLDSGIESLGERNKKRFKASGFTLLEVIIVVIIVGVLAGLALPRFINTVEYSRSLEALANLSAIRRSMERCYLFDNSFATCGDFSNLDIEDPGFVPNANFSYAFSNIGPGTFTVTAARVGDNTSLITINQDGAKGGAGSYSNIR